MSDINDVRERLELELLTSAGWRVIQCLTVDLRTLLADHARLQADADRLEWLEGFVRRAYVYGASFDFARPCEGETGGYRFVTRRRHRRPRQPTLRAAIDKAMKPTKGEGGVMAVPWSNACAVAGEPHVGI